MILNFGNYPSLHGLLSSEDLDAMLSGRVERGGNFEVTKLWLPHLSSDRAVEMSARVWTQDGRPVSVEVDCFKVNAYDLRIQGVCIKSAAPVPTIYPELSEWAD